MSTENERAAQEPDEDSGPDRAARAHEEEDRRPPEATDRVKGD